METKKRRWPAVVLLIFILVVAALYVYLYLMPEISGSLTPTYIVQYASIQKTDDAHCIVVRDEEVVKANHTGSVSYYAKETEKTRKGVTVADIYSGSNKYSLNCESTGFISYYIDSYEDFFNPSNLGSLDLEQYWEFDVVPENTVRNEITIEEPVYKLIKSNTWYFLVFVPQDEMGNYALNSTINIILDDGTTIPASVSRFLGDGDKRAIVASTKRFYENFAKLRAIDVTIVTKEVSGLLVPSTAVAENEEGKTGVYVLGIDDEYAFKEVEIIGNDNENILVADGQNLKLYDEIKRTANH